MAIRTNHYPVPEVLPVRHVLASVHDKTGLDILVEGILEVNPQARFYSTGGTGEAIKRILGSRAASNYKSVEEFTGCPEMEGGLVKTLHPKIHAGLLAERGNPVHEAYLRSAMEELTGTSGVFFDLMVGGFYPFAEEVTKESVTPEIARANIDIGGPAMVRAAAKNWHGCAVLHHPSQYGFFVNAIRGAGGVPAHVRFSLAVAAFMAVAEYDDAIANYLPRVDWWVVKKDLKWEGSK